MLSTIAKLILIGSSIAPVGFVYACVALLEGEIKTALCIIFISVVLFLLCPFWLHYMKSKIEKINPFKITKASSSDGENIGFLSIYLLPLLTSSINDLKWVVLAPIFFIFSVLIAKGYSYHFNPLIGMLGWHFYTVESQKGVTYVLITKRQLKDVNEDLAVGQLTEYILIDLKGETP